MRCGICTSAFCAQIYHSNQWTEKKANLSEIDSYFNEISNQSAILAIVALGASFTFSSIKGNLKENILVVAARLIIILFITLFLAAHLGFNGEAFACLIVVFGSPVEVSSFAMAQQMGGDEQLAGQLVVLTSALCGL